LGARVISDRARYTSGEWRHGVYIFGAERVRIEGLESSGHGGDGFYIGGPPGKASSDVMLIGCNADNNRRQGLSITSAQHVRVIDCEFTNTAGTAPQFGIDLEPNDPPDMLNDILILRAQTRNNSGGGIMIWLKGLVGGPTKPVDVTIIDHFSEAESPHLYTNVPLGLSVTLRYGPST
jgi:hypothetical protein